MKKIGPGPGAGAGSGSEAEKALVDKLISLHVKGKLLNIVSGTAESSSLGSGKAAAAGKGAELERLFSVEHSWGSVVYDAASLLAANKVLSSFSPFSIAIDNDLFPLSLSVSLCICMYSHRIIFPRRLSTR
jgi:hypothetical protein